MFEPSNDEGAPFEVNVRNESSQTNQVASVTDAPRTEVIRLGYIYCDRNYFDGVKELSPDWLETYPLQTWHASIEEIEWNDPHKKSVLV